MIYSNRTTRGCSFSEMQLMNGLLARRNISISDLKIQLEPGANGDLVEAGDLTLVLCPNLCRVDVDFAISLELKDFSLAFGKS